MARDIECAAPLRLRGRRNRALAKGCERDRRRQEVRERELHRVEWPLSAKRCRLGWLRRSPVSPGVSRSREDGGYQRAIAPGRRAPLYYASITGDHHHQQARRDADWNLHRRWWCRLRFAGAPRAHALMGSTAPRTAGVSNVRLPRVLKLECSGCRDFRSVNAKARYRYELPIAALSLPARERYRGPGVQDTATACIVR